MSVKFYEDYYRRGIYGFTVFLYVLSVVAILVAVGLFYSASGDFSEADEIAREREEYSYSVMPANTHKQAALENAGTIKITGGVACVVASIGMIGFACLLGYARDTAIAGKYVQLYFEEQERQETIQKTRIG